MNCARELYLNAYYKINATDHLIKKYCMYYQSWKYWHAPMLHDQALSILVALNKYQVVITSDYNDRWQISNPIDF